MDNTTRSRMLTLTLILVSLTVLFAVSTDQSSAATIDVGPTHTYTTINSGIAAANANDDIVVHHDPNNYTEQVVVNKQGLNIKRATGEDVTVQTTGSGTVFSINSVNGVTINGFKIQGNDANQGTGISLSNANYCNIINNYINTRWKGIANSGSSNTINNNTINDTTIAVSLTYPSNYNKITNNKITNPTYNPDTQSHTGLREDGQYFGSWTPNQNNQYINNTISNVNMGIFIQQGSNFTISGNNITIKDTYNYPWAITLSVGSTDNQFNILNNNSIKSEGKVNPGSRGIYLISNPSSPANADLQIYSNSITNFTNGIYTILYTPTGVSNTQIYTNRISNNTQGLSWDSSTTPVTAINNWWGKNSGLIISTDPSPPASYDIWYNQGTLTYDPWIILGLTANPNTILVGGTSIITADLTKNSNNVDTTTLYPNKYVPDGINTNYSSDALGSVNPAIQTTTNGKSTTTFTGNSPGVSVVSATVDDQTVTTDVTINPLTPTTIVVNPLSGFKGDIVNLVATLTNTQNNQPINHKTINYSVNGSYVGSAFTNPSGIATYAYTILQNTGTYKIYAQFNKDSTYAGSSNNNTLTVNHTPTAIVVNSANGFKGDIVNLVATLTNTHNNQPISGKTINYSVNGSYVGSAFTNALGIAIYAYTILQNTGTYKIYAQFNQDTTYAGSSGFNNLQVAVRTPTALVVNSANGLKSNIVNLVATLTNTQNNQPINHKTINYSVNGSYVGSAFTNTLGIAIYAYTILQNTGTYKIYAQFNQDTTYATSSGTNTLTVN